MMCASVFAPDIYKKGLLIMILCLEKKEFHFNIVKRSSSGVSYLEEESFEFKYHAPTLLDEVYHTKLCSLPLSILCRLTKIYVSAVFLVRTNIAVVHESR